MNDEARPEQTEPVEQTEPTPAATKPKMCKLAVVSILCLVAVLAVLAMFLNPNEAMLPLAVNQMLIPAGIAFLALALITGVAALVMIKSSAGALGGRRLALLGIIIPIVAVAAYLRTATPAEEEEQLSPSSQCKAAINELGADLLAYAKGNDGKLPAADKWCDILLGKTKDESAFKCPVAEGGRCSFALNKYAAEAGSDLPENMVLLFESKPGWNQVGGPELFVAPHESRGGERGNVVFANGISRFISEDRIEELKWNPGEDPEEKEEEEE